MTLLEKRGESGGYARKQPHLVLVVFEVVVCVCRGFGIFCRKTWGRCLVEGLQPHGLRGRWVSWVVCVVGFLICFKQWKTSSARVEFFRGWPISEAVVRPCGLGCHHDDYYCLYWAASEATHTDLRRWGLVMRGMLVIIAFFCLDTIDYELHCSCRGWRRMLSCTTSWCYCCTLSNWLKIWSISTFLSNKT